MNFHIIQITLVLAFFPLTTVPTPREGVVVPTATQTKPIKAPVLPEVEQLAPIPVPEPEPAPVAPVASGGCMDWLVAAGVDDIDSAIALINRESGCNPAAQNPGGACGVAQELPCGKSGCGRYDGACQVRWMNGYVLSVYGSWAAGLNHSYQYNWY